MCERKDICIWECFSHILIQMCIGADKAVIFRIMLFIALLEWQFFGVSDRLKEKKGCWGFENCGYRIWGLFYPTEILC